LYQKARERERILLQYDPPSITYNLVDASKHDTGHEAPFSPADPLNDMYDHGEGEEADEGPAGAQRRAVVEDTPVYGADGEGAIRVGAVGDDPRAVRELRSHCGRADIVRNKSIWFGYSGKR
jgi:hypothetical protein